MVVQQNQLDTVFQNQIGRAPTDYEVKKFSTASPQTLASIKDTYGKLNKDTSISDYLTSTGQDSSLEARTALGSKYGINNIGTPEGNTALLTALKSGKEPTPAVTPITGSIVPPQATQAPTTGVTPTPQQTPTTAPTTVGGSITGATGTTPEQPVITPDIEAKKAVDDAYAQQQEKQKAVADIDSSLARLKSEKMAEIARSGGVVNEASLTSELLRENEPLLARRKQLVGEYTQANQNYQKANADYKNIQAQSIKEQQLAQGEARIAETQRRNLTQEEIAKEKLAQSNVKVVKMTSRDEYGNVVGEYTSKINLVQPDGSTKPMPLTSTGAPTESAKTYITSGVVGAPETKSITSVNYVTSPAYASSFKGNADAPTDENQNIKIPGTTLTVGSLYQGALDWMAKPQTVGSARGQKSVQIKSNEAIASKGAAILQQLGVDKLKFEAGYKANAGALNDQIKRYGQFSVNEKQANKNFEQLIGLAKKADASIVTTGSPIIDGWIKTGSVQATRNQAVNNYVGALVLTMTEYAKVITGQTGGSAVSDSARAETAKLVQAGLNADAIQSFYDNTAKPEIDNRKQSFLETTQELTGGLTSGLKTGKQALVSKGNLTPAQFVEKALTSHGLKYDEVVAKNKPLLQAGESLAVDNETGDVIAVTASDDKSKYTPL